MAGRDDASKYPGVYQESIVNQRATIPNSSTAVALGIACNTVVIGVDPGAADLHINLSNAAATTSMFKIPNGTSFTYTGPPIKDFYVIGTAAGPNAYNIMAW
jgi:hypothetical protein